MCWLVDRSTHAFFLCHIATAFEICRRGVKNEKLTPNHQQRSWAIFRVINDEHAGPAILLGAREINDLCRRVTAKYCQSHGWQVKVSAAHAAKLILAP